MQKVFPVMRLSTDCERFLENIHRIKQKKIKILLESPFDLPDYVASQVPKYQYGAISFAKAAYLTSKAFKIETYPPLYDVIDLYGAEHVFHLESVLSSQFLVKYQAQWKSNEANGSPICLVHDRLGRLRRKYPYNEDVAQAISPLFGLSSYEQVAACHNLFVERQKPDGSLSLNAGEAFGEGILRTIIRGLSRFQRYHTIYHSDEYVPLVKGRTVFLQDILAPLVGESLPHKSDFKIGPKNDGTTYLACFACCASSVAPTRNMLRVLTGSHIQRDVLTQLQEHAREPETMSSDMVLGGKKTSRRLSIRWPTEAVNLDNSLDRLINAKAIRTDRGKYYPEGSEVRMGDFRITMELEEMMQKCQEYFENLSLLNKSLIRHRSRDMRKEEELPVSTSSHEGQHVLVLYRAGNTQSEEIADALTRYLAVNKTAVWNFRKEMRFGESITSKEEMAIERAFAAVIVYTPDFLEGKTAVEEYRALIARRRRDPSFRVGMLLVGARHEDLPEFMQDYLYVTIAGLDDPRMEESFMRILRDLRYL